MEGIYVDTSTGYRWGMGLKSKSLGRHVVTGSGRVPPMNRSLERLYLGMIVTTGQHYGLREMTIISELKGNWQQGLNSSESQKDRSETLSQAFPIKPSFQHLTNFPKLVVILPSMYLHLSPRGQKLYFPVNLLSVSGTKTVPFVRNFQI